jgi:hypothetical protein
MRWIESVGVHSDVSLCSKVKLSDRLLADQHTDAVQGHIVLGAGEQ